MYFFLHLWFHLQSLGAYISKYILDLLCHSQERNDRKPSQKFLQSVNHRQQKHPTITSYNGMQLCRFTPENTKVRLLLIIHPYTILLVIAEQKTWHSFLKLELGISGPSWHFAFTTSARHALGRTAVDIRPNICDPWNVWAADDMPRFPRKHQGELDLDDWDALLAALSRIQQKQQTCHKPSSCPNTKKK